MNFPAESSPIIATEDFVTVSNDLDNVITCPERIVLEKTNAKQIKEKVSDFISLII